MASALRDSSRDLQDDRLAIEALTHSCRRLLLSVDHVARDSTRDFHRVVSGIHDVCGALIECEAANVDRLDIQHVIEPARRLHARSPFIRRLQTWPRGYPGDFETIEWLWSGFNRADDPLGQAFERYALTSSIAQQHRNKVAFQASSMLLAMREHTPCRILSIACGSSPDLRSIATHITPETELILSDGDRDALAFSANALAAHSNRVHCIHGMVPRVLRPLRARGPYHIALAGGLFDYLSDRMVVSTLSTIWRLLLAPGGTIVFTNIATGNPFRVWLENLADWRLIERSEADIHRLCNDAGVGPHVHLERDSTGLAILVTIRKPVID
jgi:extracellular factor (EF) 3-hydroxypalmitic acid methyl ester biosynthesis protein